MRLTATGRITRSLKTPPCGPGSSLMSSPMIRLVAVAAVAMPAVVFGQSAQAPLTPETMWQLKRIGTPALSPDGKLAVYPVTRFDAESDKGDADLFMVATSGGKPQRLTSMKGNDPSGLQPDGAGRLRRQARRRQAVAIRDRVERR
jgi:hypothetical protein